MDRIDNIEQKLAGWYEKAPHLPTKGREWIANNVWWITLIGVILGGLSSLGVLAMALLSTLPHPYSMWPYGLFPGQMVTLFFLGSVIGIVMTIVAAAAITPLKNRRRRGWQLLFIVSLIDVVTGVLSFLFFFRLDSLIQGALELAIGLYFLFEVRSYFTTVDRAPKPTDKSQDPR